MRIIGLQFDGPQKCGNCRVNFFLLPIGNSKVVKDPGIIECITGGFFKCTGGFGQSGTILG